MGNCFSFVSVKFQPNTPSNFPIEDLAAYLADSYKHKSSDITDREIFTFFRKKIKDVLYTDPIDIQSKKRFFNIFSTVLVSLNTERHIVPPEIKGIFQKVTDIRPGIEIKTGYTWPPNTLSASLKLFAPQTFSFTSMVPSLFEFQLSFQKPNFSKISSLSEEHPVPSSKYQFKTTQSHLLDQYFDTTGINYSYAFKNFTKIVTASAYRVDNVTPDEDKKDSILFFDLKSYDKFALSLSKRLQTGNRYTELAVLTSSGDIKPFPFFKIIEQHVFCFPGYTKGFFESGALLSPFSVPHKERFHPGGPPFARGIPFYNFSQKICGVHSGCDFYCTGGFETSVRLLPKLDFHFFVNSGFSLLTEPTFFFDFPPSFSAYFSYGCGYVYHLDNEDVEFNFNIPFMKTDGLNFSRFQWAITKK